MEYTAKCCPNVSGDIQLAIDKCAASGGGTVIVPNGEWYTKALHLKSNINLHLENGAEIYFSDNPEDYLPVVFTRWEGTECYTFQASPEFMRCRAICNML